MINKAGNMRKVILALVLSISVSGINFAQENQQDTNINFYTFFVNVVSEQFRFPLIGFINIAGGNHGSPQIGFVNWNQNNFSTVQLSFLNTAGGDMAGAQMGFVNTAAGGVNGLQLGFINTVVQSFKGVQLGFVNMAVGEEANGLQLGLVNTSIHTFNGTQLSFVNITKQVNGLQFGFINYSDSIEKGMPIGFLSIVRNGGYKAIEFGVSELSPFNLSFKIGIEKFYTAFIVGYNPFREGVREQIMCGAGFGSIIKIRQLFYFNPEIMSYNGINDNVQHYLSIVPYFGYTIMPNVSVAIGPSVVWTYSDTRIDNPFFRIIEHAINDTNKLYFGARLALRLCW